MKAGFSFSAKIAKIGINPYVVLLPAILKSIFKEAGKSKGPIPVQIIISKTSFVQNLVKYKGRWRLYLNTPMRKTAGKEVGEVITLSVKYDPVPRTIAMHPKLESALKKNKAAKSTFDQLPPSRQKEIVRYISFLKTETSIDRNVARAISFLSGTGRFIGRDKP